MKRFDHSLHSIVFFSVTFLSLLIGLFALSTHFVSADCDSDKTCRQRSGDRPYCKPGGRGTCVQCIKDADCKNSEFCSGFNNKCVPKNTPTPTYAPSPTPINVPYCEGPASQVILIMDASNSMKGQLGDAKRAANGFIDIFKRDDRGGLGVFTFNSDSFSVNSYYDLSWYAYFDTVKSVISGINIKNNQPNGSCLECAVDAAEDDFEWANNEWPTYYDSTLVTPNKYRPFKRILIILSDGKINWWVSPDNTFVTGPDLSKGRAQAEAAINRLATRLGVQVWTIHYGDSNGQTYMANLVRNGGQAYHRPDATALDSIYNAIANTLVRATATGRTFYDPTGSGSTANPEGGFPVGLYDASNNLIRKVYSDYYNSGNFQINNICPGTVSIKGIPEYGYKVTYPPSGGYTIGAAAGGTYPNNNLGFGFNVTTPTTGTMQGSVFVDTNGNGKQDSGETAYGGSITFTSSPSGTRTFTSGAFTFTNVPVNRSYTLRVTAPTGYRLTSSNTYIVTINADGTCSTSPQGPTCSNYAVQNLNVGITNAIPWIQVGDGSIRNDVTGIDNQIPNTTTNKCTTVTIRNGSSGSPGVVYSGNKSSTFGNGSASDPITANWLVEGGSTAYSNNNSLKSAYDSILATLKTNNESTIDLSTYCETSDCTLGDDLENKPYIVQNANLTLTNASLISTKKVVVLVDGDLHINGNIQVLPGAYLEFVVKGNIYVNNTVGDSVYPYSCAVSTTFAQIQGIFSSDNAIYVNGTGACPTPDRQLNVAGSFVTNAKRATGGKLVNNRTLCGRDVEYPSITIQSRPDFLLNAPTYLLRTTTTWQEVAP